MYNQTFRNQAVKEIKNGSTITAVSNKFGVAKNTLSAWVDKYDKKMHKIMGNGAVESSPTPKPTKPVKASIQLKSVKILINGEVVTIGRNDVLRMLDIFNTFDGHKED